MTICVEYRMKAYIDADDVEQAKSAWCNTDLEFHDYDNNVYTAFIEETAIYDANTFEEIKDWKP